MINLSVPKLPRPPFWSRLALYEKVKYYRSVLGPDFAPFVDKLAAKTIVQSQIPESVLKIPHVVRILNGPDDLNESDLQPGKVIIKATHGSGWNIFVDSTHTVEECRARLRKWSKSVYNGGVEAQYKYVQPRFFIEARICEPLLNVKIRCINGKAIPFVTVVDEQGHKNFYNFDWQLYKRAEIPNQIDRPERLDEIISIAEQLAQPFEFVRVDFYSVEGAIYFSEFTFTPSNGQQILPHRIELELGKSW